MGDPSWGWSDDQSKYNAQNHPQDGGGEWQTKWNMPSEQPTTDRRSAPNYYSQTSHFVPPSSDYYVQNQAYTSAQPNSYSYEAIPAFPQQLMSDPMLNAAKQIGGQFAEQQKEKLTKYLSAFQLKYYFAVDNSYVGKKLAVIMFPFFHRDWVIKYDSSDSPVPPKLDVNAPDLYIPLMAFITYILISGFALGTQGRFTPEQLGMLTTNAMAYLIFENVIILFTRYIMNISQSLTFWHSLAYSSYKFVGMNLCLLAFMIGGKMVYTWVLVYTSISTVLFLLRTVKTFVLDVQSMYHSDNGRKRKIYLLLFIAFTQPFLIWWLTSGVMSQTPGKMDFAQLALSGMGLKQAANKGQVPMQPNGDVDYEALLKMP